MKQKKKNEYGEDTSSRLKTPLNQAELWEIKGGGYTIKAFGYICHGREYVLAKTWVQARALARILTRSEKIDVIHPDFVLI